jgi:hypothetical protein
MCRKLTCICLDHKKMRWDEKFLPYLRRNDLLEYLTSTWFYKRAYLGFLVRTPAPLNSTHSLSLKSSSLRSIRPPFCQLPARCVGCDDDFWSNFELHNNLFVQRGQCLWILLHANRGWDLLGRAGSMRVADELRGFPKRWHAKKGGSVHPWTSVTSLPLLYPETLRRHRMCAQLNLPPFCHVYLPYITCLDIERIQTTCWHTSLCHYSSLTLLSVLQYWLRVIP